MQNMEGNAKSIVLIYPCHNLASPKYQNRILILWKPVVLVCTSVILFLWIFPIKYLCSPSYLLMWKTKNLITHYVKDEIFIRIEQTTYYEIFFKSMGGFVFLAFITQSQGLHLHSFFVSDTCGRLKALCSQWLTKNLLVLCAFILLSSPAILTFSNNDPIFCHRKAALCSARYQ